MFLQLALSYKMILTTWAISSHYFLRYRDFQEMGGVKLKDLKMHTNAVGGKWGEDTWAALVKDNYEEAFNDTGDDVDDALENTQAKRALLIPLTVFPSSHIMKVAEHLGQTDDYKKFGADEETPSGVEEIRNSTQRPGQGESLNLVLSDVSSILPTNGNGVELEEDNIIFDELQRPTEDDFLHDETIIGDSEDEVENETDVHESTEDESEQDEDEDDDDMVFTCVENTGPSRSKSRRSTTMKARQPRNITVVEKNNKAFFVCPCGFSSTNKSGSSRHKCRSNQDAVIFPCKHCGKVCQNAGSLKRHVVAMHSSRQSVSLPAGDLTKAPDSDTTAVNNSGQFKSVLFFPFPLCFNPICFSHVLYFSIAPPVGSGESREEVPTTLQPVNPPATSLTCDICGKTLSRKSTLLNHMKKIHGQVIT